MYTNSSVDNTSLPAVAKNFGLEPQVKWGQIIGDLQSKYGLIVTTRSHDISQNSILAQLIRKNIISYSMLQDTAKAGTMLQKPKYVGNEVIDSH